MYAGVFFSAQISLKNMDISADLVQTQRDFLFWDLAYKDDVCRVNSDGRMQRVGPTL